MVNYEGDVRGRLAAPSVYIATESESVGAPLVGALKSALPTGRAGTSLGQAIPLHLIRPFERRLRLCDPEVATSNSCWELTVGSSLKEKLTATKTVAGASTIKGLTCTV